MKGVKYWSMEKDNNIVRFLLTFFLGWIGSLIINHTNLKLVTCGIYGLVASICNLSFDPAKASNIGYAKE